MLTSVTEFNGALETAQPVRFLASMAATTTGVSDCWRDMRPVPGPNAATGEALTRASTGALRFNPSSSGNSLRLVGVDYDAVGRITLMVYDRLCQAGGFVGNVDTVQTTGLPTPTLPRYDNGVGVLATLYCQVGVGSTEVVATITYTNQAGTSGREGRCRLGGTGNNSPRKFQPMTFQDGDTGIRSVESIQLSASTGTAGNFAVLLYRPLVVISSPSERGTSKSMLEGQWCGLAPVVHDEACLGVAVFPNLSLSSSFIGGTIFLSED